MKRSEQQHIDSLGERRAAIAAASLSIRQDSKLVGLDKIRGPMAIAAALKATGCPDHEGFVIPKEAGPPMSGIQEFVDAAFIAAVEAAKLKISVSA